MIIPLKLVFLCTFLLFMQSIPSYAQNFVCSKFKDYKEQSACKDEYRNRMKLDIERYYNKLIKNPENKFLQKENESWIKGKENGNQSLESIYTMYLNRLKALEIENNSHNLCQYTQSLIKQNLIDFQDPKKYDHFHYGMIIDINNDGIVENIGRPWDGISNGLFIYKSGLFETCAQKPEYDECLLYPFEFLRLFHHSAGISEYYVVPYKQKNYLVFYGNFYKDNPEKFYQIIEFDNHFNYRILCDTRFEEVDSKWRSDRHGEQAKEK